MRKQINRAGPSNLLSCDGQAILHEDVFPVGYHDRLRDELDWESESIVMFGKTIKVPRLTAYYGDHPYQYAGVMHTAKAFPQVLREVKQIAERCADFRFNSVLCNLYRDGSDSMGYHRDNELEMDTQCIASLSFGQERKFKLRHRGTKEVVDVQLRDRSILLMLDCQEAWEHAIPKTARSIGERINLTFRKMNPMRHSG